MTLKIKNAILALATLLTLPLSAQSDDWQPTGEWPFVNRHFKVATIYTGIFTRSKTQAPCNIHVGNQTLWYSQNDTLLEAIPGSILRVEFPDGDVYMPVGSENYFGRILRQDTINGRVARVICVRAVDQRRVDQQGLDIMNNTQNILQGEVAGLGSFMSAVADANGGLRQEEQPVPLTNLFYFQVNGEIFRATTKNILAHIDPSRKKEYKIYTREAEIISTNESSMLKVWKDFFLNQSKKTKK